VSSDKRVLIIENRKHYLKVAAAFFITGGIGVVSFFAILTWGSEIWLEAILSTTIISSIGAGSAYLFVLYVLKNRRMTHKVTLEPDKMILDADSYHRELPYSDLEKIYYKKGVLRKMIVVLSPETMWFLGGIPLGGQKALDDFLALANKKIEEAKKTQRFNGPSNKEDR